MANPLSELLKKVEPSVVQAAREEAEQEIFELRLSILREQWDTAI